MDEQKKTSQKQEEAPRENILRLILRGLDHPETLTPEERERIKHTFTAVE